MTTNNSGENSETEIRVTDLSETNGPCTPDNRKGITLEALVTMTGEMEHLNDLVLLHVAHSGGFTGTASYFAIVTPVLDLLEKEIRIRYYDGISKDHLKHIIQVWIDKEIAGMKCREKSNPGP